MDSRQRNYLTVRQMSEKYPAFSINAIRWAIFNSDRNGFDSVIRRVGRKILLEENAFLDWIESGAKAA